MFYLGHKLRNNLFLAPMAGISDRPFRRLCRELGAGLAVTEMVTSNSLLYGSAKTRRRADHQGEQAPIVVQIAGADPVMMAAAATFNAQHGAQIIDINMGCPAKKICNVQAGSALMKNEKLVAQICSSVVKAVPNIPVTLKMRTGWDRNHKNATRIARIAEECGIQALVIHGRTRADQYTGEAEYLTIAAVKAQVGVGLRVIANGDITSGRKAQAVLAATGADGLMIGRAALGRPWIFREIDYYLKTGKQLAPPDAMGIYSWLRKHLMELYDFYGEDIGVKIARKHITWYAKGLCGAAVFRRKVNALVTPQEQLAAIEDFFLSYPITEKKAA